MLKHILAAAFVCSALFTLLPAQSVAAVSQKLEAARYELDENASFSVGGGTRLSDKDKFRYGAFSMGELSLDGNVTAADKYNNYNAYEATGDITIRYSPSISEYKTSDEEKWHLKDSDAEKISGVDLDGDIDMGAVLIQSSSDGENWGEYKPASKRDVFGDNRSDLTSLAVIKESDYLKGRYYRVSVAYEMEKKTGNQSVGDIEIGLIGKYETKRFIEVYKFYVGYGSDPVSFRDIDGKETDGADTFTKGFSFSKGGTNFDTTVSINGGRSRSVSNNDIFTSVGKYEFTVRSELGREYTHSITVTEGMTQQTLSPKVYENGKNGYTAEGKANSGMASYGKHSLSAVMIGQDAENNIAVSKYKGVDAYGISGGKSCTFYMKVDPPENGYFIADDDYGKDKSETVMEAKVGKVGKGVLLVQKSKDNVNWQKIDSDYYADGLHNNDYSKYYSGKGYFNIYSPSGAELLNGLFLRITYAYNVRPKGSKENNRCVEVYNIYICSSDLDAVTFHNLTLEDKTDNKDKDYRIECHKSAETLLSGSLTVTGFKIDTSMNPTVGISVKKDDKEISVPSDKIFEETGKYNITLTSKVGTEKELILYVDTRSSEEMIRGYFGPGSIIGKRIFSETSTYPVFEGGKTHYNVKAVDARFRALKGTIKNNETGKKITVFQGSTAKTGELTEEGFYTAVFTTKPDDEKYPGDHLKITFSFSIIKEGTAPGPQENQKLLEKYSLHNVSDYYPMYYGVTEKVNNRDVTVAFADKKDAVKFAVELEYQKAIPLDNETYQYEDSERDVHKVTYYSDKELMNAINEYAEKRVQMLFFDLTQQQSYLTIEDKDIENSDDIRKLDLEDNTVVAGKDQYTKLAEKGAYQYPLISPKPYGFAQINGEDVETGYHDFQFVKDEHGYDSQSFYITDSEGKRYKIGYKCDVGKALQEQGCKSGVVTITEKTCYDDTNEYKALFIADGDNTSNITLSYSINDAEKTVTFDQNDHNALTADYFSVSALSDELDPYSIVRIANKNVNGENPYYAAADQLDNKLFAAKGEYEVAVINRLGYCYSFNVSVTGKAEIVLDLQGEGENISTYYGAKNVTLPKLTKTGYELKGFEDESGNLYSDEIAEILFKGNTVLHAKWEAKQYQLTLLNADGSRFDTMTVSFDKENKLPVPDVENGMKFVCWLNNGVPVENNTFTLVTEGDITLTASVEKSSSKSIVPIVTAISGICAVGIAMFIRRRKRHEK